MERRDGLAGLVELMDRLRGPDGCPWDREQSYASLRPYLLEECFEVAEAIDLGEPALLCEELGDLLFQIVFLSRLAKEDGRFTIEDVLRGISEKLIRRHPHVFAEESAETADEVARKWEEIKTQEKGADRPFLASVPSALPALLGAQRLGDKAAQVGFDWPDPGAVLDKVEEEAGELREALVSADPRAIREELGDLLFSIVMLARKIGVDADAALAGTNAKFRSRFTRVEQELKRRGGRLADAGTETLEELWNESKRS